jgi:O-antigen ligase
MESVRPFYSLGLFLIGFLLIFNYVKFKTSLALSLLKQPQIIILILILFYFLILSIFGQGREIKDYIYFIYWLFTSSLLIIIYINNKFHLEELMYLLSKSILIFAIITSILAIFTFFGLLEFEYGNYILKQNYWTITRMHGYMGEPTALGGLIGFAIISLSYMRSHKRSSYDWIIYTFLIISLLWSGSRNAIVSLISVYMIIFIMNNKINIFRIIKAFSTILMVLIILILFVIYYLDINIDLLLLAVNRNDIDASQESSRLYTWFTAFEMYSNGNILEQIFGAGAGMLRNEYRAAFNASLEILYDYGIVGFILYQFLFISALYMGVKRYKTTNYEYYKYGVMLLVYGFSFSLFMSFFPSSVFNFPSFAFTFGIVLTAIPIKYAFNRSANAR